MTPARSDTPDRPDSRGAFLEATEALVTDIAGAELERQLEAARTDELARDYLELEQVMAILRIGATKARELVRTGTLASLQPGKKILVPRSEVIRYAEAQLLRGREVRPGSFRRVTKVEGQEVEATYPHENAVERVDD